MFRFVQTKEDQVAIYLLSGKIKEKNKRNTKSAIKKIGLPQQAEVTQGVPGRLRPQIFLMFGTTRVVGCQLYAPGRLYPRRNPWYPGTHF
jgi:hypothetical protein